MNIRVLLQVIQRLVQPILEQDRRPPGLYLTPQDDHELRLALYVVIGPVHHRAKEGAKGQHPRQQQGQHSLLPQGPPLSLVGAVVALPSPVHPRASSSSAASVSHFV